MGKVEKSITHYHQLVENPGEILKPHDHELVYRELNVDQHALRGNHRVHQRLLHGGCLSLAMSSRADQGTGVQTGHVDFGGELASDESERTEEGAGRHSVPDGPVLRLSLI